MLRGVAAGEPVTDPATARVTARVAAGLVTMPELVRRLDAEGVQAQDVTIRRPTLHEVFLDRTGTEALA